MTAPRQRTGSGGAVPASHGEHIAVRPSWECRRCGDPWPCTNAKAALLVEFRLFPSVLAIYMSAQMDDASRDFVTHGDQPTDFYERFMSWLQTPAHH